MTKGFDDRSGPFEGSDRLVYREPDQAFKSRLNTAIQIGWVYNTALMIITILGIFYLLGLPMTIGLILGILLALLANFHFLMIQVSSGYRWEIYRNKVVVPRAFRRGPRTIHFHEIESIERESGIIGDRVVILLRDGPRLSIDVSGQEAPLQNLLLIFDKYRRVREREGIAIRIPSVTDGPGER